MGTRLVLLLAVLAAATPGHAASVFEDLNRELTDAVIVPGYQRFAAATGPLATAVPAFCAGPTPERLKAARQAFEHAMLAWQQVQPIGFGPIVAGERTSAIQLFPDRAISRLLSKALAAKDPGSSRRAGSLAEVWR